MQKWDCWIIFQNIQIRKLKISAYDEEFIVPKLNLISTSVNSLNLQFTQHASHLHTLLQAHNLAPQISAKRELAPQSINLINTLVTRSHKLEFYLSPVPQNQITNIRRNLNNSKCAYPASQKPIKTSLAKRCSPQFNHFLQNQNEKRFVKRDTHFFKPNFPPIKRRSENIFESHHPKVKSVLFA